jgi:hypothetical protein
MRLEPRAITRWTNRTGWRSPAFNAMLGRAQAFAATLGDGTITHEHVLLALIWDPTDQASQRIWRLGVSRERLVERLAEEGEDEPRGERLSTLGCKGGDAEPEPEQTEEDEGQPLLRAPDHLGRPRSDDPGRYGPGGPRGQHPPAAADDLLPGPQADPLRREAAAPGISLDRT